MEHIQTSDRHTSADKLVQVLLAFEAQPRWKLTDMSAFLALPKSTVHRLLSSLKEQGLVIQDLTYGEYQLGYRLWTMTSRALPYSFFQETSQPVLRDLADQSGETAYLQVPEGPYSLAVAKVESKHAVRLTTEVGARAPMYRGAGHKVVLAHLPFREQASVIAYWCPDKTAQEGLLEQMAQIKKVGYTYSAGEYNPGAAAFAVPVLASDRHLIAGVCIAGPANRLTEKVAKGYLGLLQQAAAELGKRLAQYSRQVLEG